MKNIINKSAAVLLNLLIPVKDLTIEEFGKRRLFVSFLSILLLPLIPFSALHLATGNAHFGIINSFMAVFLLSMIILQRKKRKVDYLYRLTMFIVASLLFFWIYSGAIEGYASLFALSFTPFALFLTGKREGMFWAVLLFLTSAAVMLNPPGMELHYTYSLKYAVRYLLTFAFIILFSYNYESVRQKYQKTITEEQNSLKLAVRQLDIENRMKTLAQEELEKHKTQLEELVAERTAELRIKNNELQKSQDEFIAGEKKYKMLADNITDLIWAADLEMNYTYFSPSVEKMFGYTVEEALSVKLNSWITPESLNKIAVVYLENIELDKAGKLPCDHFVFVEVDQIRKDGTIFPAEVKLSFIRDENKKSIGIVGITRDLTERRRAEKEKEAIQSQLMQAQKMEAVGILASGLAHDFNNLLSGIIGSFNLIEIFIPDENFPNKDKILKYISVGLESSERSSQIIKQLMTLSKKSELTLITVDINQSLHHILDICKNSFPKSVILDFRIDEQILYVMADPVQIEQVLLNLCINASHAMTIMRKENEPTGGTLTVTSAVLNSSDLSGPIPDGSLKFGKWLRIDIADTGVGMSSETQNKLFSPFFSTKEQDQGTGLGLATSYNIIRQHKGFIKVKSEAGKGSVFSIFIPCGKSDHAQLSVKQETGSLISGEGTILIIDDEKSILKVAEGILHQCGYRVMTAETPFSGIDNYRDNFKDISAVLLDLSMPGKSGIEVFHELRRINPQVKVLLSSGMIDIEAKQKAFEMGVTGVIHKPYVASELSVEMNRVLKGK
jgi:PAS domain S-box-containing protein